MRFLSAFWVSCLMASVASAEVTEDGRFENLQYHGFEVPNDGSPEAVRRNQGLTNIFEGRGFRIGIPLRAAGFLETYKSTQDAVTSGVNRIKRQEHFGHNSDITLWRDLGKLPSPKTRKAVMNNGKALPIPDLMAGVGVFDGVAFKNTNCFMCHSGVVNGIVTAGLPNSHTDQVGYSAELSLLLKVRPILETYLKSQKTLKFFERKTIDKELQELKYYLDDMQAETRDVLSKAVVRGDNMGPYVVWKKLSRLIDPATQGFLSFGASEASPYDSFFDVKELPPVDPNPWWTRAFKTSSYRYADPAEFIAAHFALNFTKPTPYVNGYHPQHVQDVSDILYFAEHVTSPAYPGALDAEKVKLGRQLFHGEIPTAAGSTLACSKCHGTYEKTSDYAQVSGWKVAYPDRGVIDVGTDDAYNKLLMSYAPLQERGKGFSAFFADQDLAPVLNLPEHAGYMAPPLVGTWASAPFFHNGSVPTLYHVLNSASRPSVWSRTNSDPFAYNLRETGLAYATLDISAGDYSKWKEASAKDPQSTDALEFRSWYNTQQAGRSNAGHRFGDAMSDAERYAVIEFLKSISGDDVVPAVHKPKQFYKFSE